MKILHAVPWYFPEGTAGTEVYVATLSSLLRAAGHDVVIAVVSRGARAHTESQHEGVRVLRYATPSAPTRAHILELSGTPGAEQLIDWIRKEQPDVVHFHTLTTGMGVREVESVHAMGITTVFTTHSSSLGYTCQRGTLLRWGQTACDGVRSPQECAACMLQQRGVPRAGAVALSRFARTPITERVTRIGGALQTPAVSAWSRARQKRLVAAVDAFVVLTQWAADVVVANGAPPEKVFVNRLGVRDPRGTPQRAARQPGAPVRIGYLGRYEDIKGVDVLARAAASLPKHLNIEVVFRGPRTSDDERAVSARLAGILGNDPRFSIGDAVPMNATYDFLASLDVLCCPSLCAEGGPTVALEARLVGTPVIGSRIGGLAEIVRDGVDGALLRPGDIQELARCMTSLADDAEQIETWRRAIGPVRMMTDVARDYIDLYENVCSRASA